MHPLVILHHVVGDMPGDGFTFAIRIGGEIDVLFTLGGFLELVDDLLLGLELR